MPAATPRRPGARPAGAPPSPARRLARALAGPAALALLGLAAWWTLAPILAGGFVHDDWTLLAAVGGLRAPWPLLLENLGHVYFYRPVGLLAWWGLVAGLGVDPWAHALAQVALQAALGAALLGALRALEVPRAGALMVAALALLHPVAAGSAAWMANRFELLAAIGLLLALRGLAAAGAGGALRWLGVAAATTLAIGSKETGLLLAPLALLALWGRTDLRRADALRLGLAVALPLALWAALRLQLPGDPTATPGLAGLDPALAWRGVMQWLALAPDALALDAPRGAGVAALVVLAALALLGLWRPATRRQTLLGLALALGPGALQWPVTAVVLGGPEALAITSNLRFYLVGLLGLALLAALGPALLAEAARAAALARRPAGPAAPGSIRGPAALRVTAAAAGLGALALAAALAPLARERAAGWAALGGDPATLAQQAALADLLAALPGGPGCKLVVEGLGGVNLPGFADHLAKAGLSADAPQRDCVVVTDPMPWQAILGADAATPAALAPLAARVEGDAPIAPAPFAGRVFVALGYAPVPPGPGVVHARWDGARLVVDARWDGARLVVDPRRDGAD